MVETDSATETSTVGAQRLYQPDKGAEEQFCLQSLEGKLVGSQLLTEPDQLWKSTTKFLTILEASFMQGHAMLIRGSMQKSSRERRARVGFHKGPSVGHKLKK